MAWPWRRREGPPAAPTIDPSPPAAAVLTPPRLPVGDATQRGLAATLRRVTDPDQSVWRKVLVIAWPVVLMNLLQSLALTVDLIFVGRLGSEALAATGVATQVFFISTTVGTGVGAAATAVVARGIGAGDQEEASRATTVAVWLVVLASLPLLAATYFLDAPLLRLLGADARIVELGALVLRILAFGLPGYVLMMAAGGALTGAGDTRPALVIGVATNVVNLVLDYALIFGALGAPRLGIAGAALATTASYTVGGLAFLWLLRRGGRPMRLVRVPAAAARALAKRLVRVATPATVEGAILSFGFTAYLVLILQFGAEALAAHQIGLRVQSFAFMPGFGFAAAASALVGQGLGRGSPDTAARNGWASIGMCVGVMVLASLPLLLFARPLAGLFTSDPGALDLGEDWIRIIVVAIPAIALHFGAAGALRGAGDTKWPLLVSVVGLWGVRLPLGWLLGVHYEWGMAGIWAGYVIEYYGRALVTTGRYAKGAWKTLKV